MKPKQLFPGTAFPPISAWAIGSFLAGFSGLAGVASGASYAGTAYESFNYTAGSTLPSGVTTGTGFNATGDPAAPSTSLWTASNTASIIGTSLTYVATGYAASTAGSASLTGVTATTLNGANSLRTLSLAQSVDTGTFWFSFLMASTATTNRTLDLGLQVTGVSPTIGRSNSTGAPAGIISLNYDGSVTNVIANPVTVGTNTHLIIGRVEFDYLGSPDSDRVSIFVDPTDVLTMDTSTPYTSDTGNIGAIAGFILRAAGSQNDNTVTAAAGTFDEIRFGTTLASVTIPEPSTSLLVAGGLSLFGLRRSRRRD